MDERRFLYKTYKQMQKNVIITQRIAIPRGSIMRVRFVLLEVVVVMLDIEPREGCDVKGGCV